MSKKERVFIILIFVIALALRLAYISLYRDEILRIQKETFGDTQQYTAVAKNFIAGRGLIVSPKLIAYRPPLYPLFLAFIYFLFGDGFWPIRIAQSVLGAFTVLFIIYLGRETFGERCARIAGLISSFYPFLIFFTAFELTETLFIFLLVLSMLFLQRCINAQSIGNFLLSGLFLGLATLCRPTVLIFIPISFIALVFLTKKKKVPWKYPLITLLLSLVVISPWVIRNYIHFHKIVFTTMSGYSFWEGNNPRTTGGPCQYWPEEIKGLSELERNTYLRKATIRVIAEDPKRFARLLLVKFGRFWNVIPNAEAFSSFKYRLIAIVSYVPTLILAILGMGLTFRLRRKFLLFYLLIAFFTLFHMAFVGSIRYRLPIMPFMIIFSSYAIIWIVYRGKGEDICNGPSM